MSKTLKILPRRRVERTRNQLEDDPTTSRLLPTDILRQMRRAFGLSNGFATTSFQWKPEEFAPTRNTNGWRKIVWIFNMVLSVCHLGFCLGQCYKTLEDEEATLTSKIFIVFAVVWCVYGICLQTSNILRRDSLPMYSKGFIGFLGDLRGFVQKEDSLPAVKMGKFVFVITFNSTRVLAILYGCLAYVQPANPAFWSSVLPATQEIWPIRALLAFMEFYLYMLMSDAGCIYITVGFPYLFALLDTVRLMSDRVKERHRHVPIRRMFQLYQQLRLLTNVFDQVYAIVLVSTKTCFILFGMFSTYGCLRTEGVMSVLFAVGGGFAIVFLIVYMMLLGELHSRSTDFLSVVKTEMTTERRIGDVKWTRRQLRSMPAMSIKVGSMYFIDKPIVMTTCQILFDNCINFLLMTA